MHLQNQRPSAGTGIPADVQDAANNGDGNGDGIKDSL